MTPLAVLWSAVALGLVTAVSPCPMATNIAAVSFLSRQLARPRRVLLAGLLYTLGRTAAYVGLGVVILYLMQAVRGQADSASAVGALSRGLQEYSGLVLGPVLILAGMLLLGLLEFASSLSLGGQRLQDRAGRSGALWAFPLGVLFALSFCPISASLFFLGLIGLSTQHRSPVLLPTLFGIGTAVPVLGFALLIAFAGRHVGRVFNGVTRVERWVRLAAGVVFILAGLHYTLRHIYGWSFMS